MSKAYVGTMQVAYPIESINRKLALRSEKCVEKKITNGNNHKVIIPAAKYMGGMTRSYQVVTGNGKVETVKTQYAFVRKNKYDPNVTADMIEQKNNFSKVSKSIPVLLRNLTQVTNIQMKWREGLEDTSKTIGGISTKGYDFRGWVFAVQFKGLSLDHDYDLTKFPTTWDA